MTPSYQLYSSRRHGPLPATLAMLARLGYRRVEGHGELIAEPARLRAALDAHGLAMPTCHVPLALIEAEPRRVVDAARTLGVALIVAPHIAAEDRPRDAAGWRGFGDRLRAAFAPLADAGLGWAWHNHDFELAGAPGATPLEAMAADGPLPLELDLGWVARAGGDPCDWIDRLADRIVAVHLKDIAAPGEAEDEDGWADPGHGTLDWAAIAARLAAAGEIHWVVEHDRPADDERFARNALAAVRRMTPALP